MKTKINFLPRYKKAGKPTHDKLKRGLLTALPMALLCAIFAGVGIYMGSQRAQLTNQLDELNAYISSEQNISDYNRSIALTDENAALEALINTDRAMLAAIGSYPLPSSDVLDDITQLAADCSLTVDISSYNADGGAVSFTAESESTENINTFVETLLTSPLFAAVRYSGYSFNSSEQLYRVNVSCALAQDAGRDDTIQN